MLSLFPFQFINYPSFPEKYVSTDLLPLKKARDLLFENLA